MTSGTPEIWHRARRMAWLEALPGRKRAASQASRVALEDEYGMIHVLAVGTVEKAELLLAVGGIVGGVEIEQDLPALATWSPQRRMNCSHQVSLRRARSRAQAQ